MCSVKIIIYKSKENAYGRKDDKLKKGKIYIWLCNQSLFKFKKGFYKLFILTLMNKL